jgi:hypothetical protein
VRAGGRRRGAKKKQDFREFGRDLAYTCALAERCTGLVLQVAQPAWLHVCNACFQSVTRRLRSNAESYAAADSAKRSAAFAAPGAMTRGGAAAGGAFVADWGAPPAAAAAHGAAQRRPREVSIGENEEMGFAVKQQRRGAGGGGGEDTGRGALVGAPVGAPAGALASAHADGAELQAHRAQPASGGGASEGTLVEGGDAATLAPPAAAPPPAAPTPAAPPSAAAGAAPAAAVAAAVSTRFDYMSRDDLLARVRELAAHVKQQGRSITALMSKRSKTAEYSTAARGGGAKGGSGHQLLQATLLRRGGRGAGGGVGGGGGGGGGSHWDTDEWWRTVTAAQRVLDASASGVKRDLILNLCTAVANGTLGPEHIILELFGNIVKNVALGQHGTRQARFTRELLHFISVIRKQPSANAAADMLADNIHTPSKPAISAFDRRTSADPDHVEGLSVNNMVKAFETVRVGRCRLPVSKPELKARLVSELETKMC